MIIGGFGYCDYTNSHVYVELHKTPQSTFYSQIGLVKSTEFTNMSDADVIWASVVEVEKQRKLLNKKVDNS